MKLILVYFVTYNEVLMKLFCASLVNLMLEHTTLCTVSFLCTHKGYFVPDINMPTIKIDMILTPISFN
jgi:hypothetical protein